MNIFIHSSFSLYPLRSMHIFESYVINSQSLRPINQLNNHQEIAKFNKYVSRSLSVAPKCLRFEQGKYSPTFYFYRNYEYLTIENIFVYICDWESLPSSMDPYGILFLLVLKSLRCRSERTMDPFILLLDLRATLEHYCEYVRQGICVQWYWCLGEKLMILNQNLVAKKLVTPTLTIFFWSFKTVLAQLPCKNCNWNVRKSVIGTRT